MGFDRVPFVVSNSVKKYYDSLRDSLTYTAVKIEEGRRREEREKMNDNIV